MVAIFPNVCLWRCSLCSNLENCIEPTSYASTAYVVAIWPSFLFDSFVKIWDTCENFLGKWFTAPLAKNFPYAYEPTDGNYGPTQHLDLLNLCLTLTYFQYKGKHYKQLHGTAMGSPVSVVVAEIVMQNYDRLLDQPSYNPATSQKATTIWTLTRRAQLVCDSPDSLQDETDFLNNVFSENN